MNASHDEELTALGHIAPGERLSAALTAARSNSAQAVEFLRRHRVVGLGASRLLDPPGTSAQGEVGDMVTRRRTLSALLADAWRELELTVAETGVAAAGIKGYSTVGLYARPEHRDIGDIDLLVDDVDDAWNLAGRLREQGYDWCEYELPWLKRDGRSGQIYGQVQVWKHVGEIPVRVDVHFGGYSIRHCRLAPHRLGQKGLHTLDAMSNLPFLLGNAAGDFLIKLKDVNDIVLMLEADPKLDWRQSMDEIRAHGLAAFWNALLDEVTRTSHLSARAQAVAEELRVDGVKPERVPFGRPEWRARCRATVADSYRAGRRERGFAAGVSLAWSAYRYYRRPLKLAVQARCAHGRKDLSLVDRMRNDVCVRLVPTRLIRERSAGSPRDTPAAAAQHAVPGTDALRVETADGHAFVRAAGEAFVPTVYYNLCEAQGGYR